MSTALYDYRKYWAECFGPAPELPMTRAEMDALGWDSCDIIIVTGDAYVDHPSFGMALVGRLLEDQGYRVGIIAQPDWQSTDAFKELGEPNLFFGVAAGNMAYALRMVGRRQAALAGAEMAVRCDPDDEDFTAERDLLRRLTH